MLKLENIMKLSISIRYIKMWQNIQKLVLAISKSRLKKKMLLI